MAGYVAARLSRVDLLEHVLTVPEGDESGLADAVTTVAEALADDGALVLDEDGFPAQGATDAEVVAEALDAYARLLLLFGEIDQAAEAVALIDRIHHLDQRPDIRGLRIL